MLLASAVVDLAQPVAERLVQAGLVDLDITLAFQAVLFLLLVIALPALAFKPLVERMQERDARTDGARAEAKKVSHDADAKVQEYESRTAQAKRRALEERAQVRVDAQRKAAELLTEARAQTAARIDAGLATQRQAAEVARTQLRTDAATVAGQIAHKLVEG
jgi:F-type H+-transporting ATPase subunit b